MNKITKFISEQMFLIAYIIIVGVGLIIAVLTLTSIANGNSTGQTPQSKDSNQIRPISDVHQTTINKIMNKQPSYKVNSAPEINQTRTNPFWEN